MIRQRLKTFIHSEGPFIIYGEGGLVEFDR